VSDKRFAIFAVLGAMVMVVLDAAMANIALAAMARDLHVTPARSVWIVTSYQMALVVALLPCAALGESRSYRRVFRGGIAVFTVASVCCALAPSLPWLIAARFVQGLGGAAVMALGVALFRFIVPHRQLGTAIGWNALAVALASGAGPTIGAAILSLSTWRYLFLVNLPLGAAVLLAARVLPRTPGTGRPLDLVSVALNTGALSALVIGASVLATRPVLAAALFATTGFSFTMLVRRDILKDAPLIPFDLLRDRAFRIALLASILCFTGQAVGLITLPFYLQHEFHQDIWTTGLYMTAWPATVAVAAPVTARLARHISSAWLCAAGGTFLAIGLGAAAAYPLQGDPSSVIVFTMLCGLGFSLFNVPNNRTLYLAAPRARGGAAGGLQASARLLGQTSGAVAISLLFTLTTGDAATRIGLSIAAVLTATAGIVSTFRHATSTRASLHQKDF